MIFLTIVAGLQLVVIGALIYLRDREREANARQLADFNLSAERERLQLVNHIKSPAFLSPPTGPPRQVQADQPHPNLAKIGTYAPTGD